MWIVACLGLQFTEGAPDQSKARGMQSDAHQAGAGRGLDGLGCVAREFRQFFPFAGSGELGGNVQAGQQAGGDGHLAGDVLNANWRCHIRHQDRARRGAAQSEGVTSSRAIASSGAMKW